MVCVYGLLPSNYVPPEECGGDILQKLMGMRGTHIDMTDNDIELIIKNSNVRIFLGKCEA